MKRTSPTISQETANRVLLLAWGHRHHEEIRGLLRRALGGQRAAARALDAWHRLPLPIGGLLPDTLPGGLPIPPASTPWARQSSPLPLVDLPADDVLELAWDVLWAWLATEEFAPTPAILRLQALTGGELDHGRARLLIAGWRNNGHALACIRAAHPAETPPRLSLADQRAFLAAALRGASSHQHNWRLLVRVGLSPQHAFEQVRCFNPRWGALPDGQPIPRAAREGACGLPSHSQVTPGPPSPPEGLRPALTSAGGWSVARLFVYECLDSLVLDRPLHWLLLSSARFVEDTTIQTFAVGLTRKQDPVIFYSPTFVLGLTPDECKGVLCHEINHVLFGHLGPLPPDVPTHRAAWTIATEVTANEYVPYPLPGDPLTIAGYRLPPHESTLTRYQRLKRRALPEVTCPDLVIVEPLAAELGRSGAGEGNGKDSSPAQVIQDAITSVGEALDPETREALGRHAGSVPGSQASLLDPPGVSRLSWKRLLDQLVRAINVRESVRTWPSRRHPDLLGVVPGRRRRELRRKVLAAIDTSGSMSNRELGEVSDELFALLRQNVRVAVVQCDAEIHRQAWLRPGDRVVEMVGRGGTDLRPPFQRQILDRYQPDLLVYFTDGYGPAPSAAPPGVPVLWVLTGKHPVAPALWGHVVCQRRPDQRAPVGRGPGL